MISIARKWCCAPSPYWSSAGKEANHSAELGTAVGSTRPWAAYTLGVLLTIWPGLFFPRHAVKEHFATELERKVCFSAFPGLVCVTWANGWQGRDLWGTLCACRNLGFDFSNIQTICRQLPHWQQGRGMPWSLSLLLCPSMALWSRDVPLPSSTAGLVPCMLDLAYGLLMWDKILLVSTPGPLFFFLFTAMDLFGFLSRLSLNRRPNNISSWTFLWWG